MPCGAQRVQPRSLEAALASAALALIAILGGCGQAAHPQTRATRAGPAIAACRVTDLRLSTSTQGAGQAGYTAVSVFNTSTRPCTLDGFPRVTLDSRGNRVPVNQRSVAGDITADPRVAVVTLAPEPRPSQRRPSAKNAYFLVELGNDCAQSRIMVQLLPAAPLKQIRSGGPGPGFCPLPGEPPVLTVSQYQPDPTGSP
jgi:hypothetical protein